MCAGADEMDASNNVVQEAEEPRAAVAPCEAEAAERSSNNQKRRPAQRKHTIQHMLRTAVNSFEHLIAVHMCVLKKLIDARQSCLL